MTATVVPAVLRAMLDRFTVLLPDTDVHLGVPLTNSDATALYIGVGDPTAAALQAAVTGAQDWPLATMTSREERITVRLAIEAHDGAGDVLAALDAAWDVFATIADELRTNRNLGVPGVLWFNMGSDYSSDHAQLGSGATALLTFSITATARF